MRKLLMTGVASVLLIATLLTGCNGSKTNTTISDTESAIATTESTKEAVKDILTYVKGIKDITVEQNAKNIDYMKNVTYDKKYIKSVTVDSSKVDITTVGKYELVYTITPVDTKTDIATVVKTVTIEVITTDDAQTKADNGEVVITDNGETKKTSDGTTPADTSSNEVTSDNTEVTTTKPSSDNTSGSSETTQSVMSDDSATDNAEPSKTEEIVEPSESEEPAEPAETEHIHNWVPITETVTVTDSPATTKQELVSDAWDETVVTKEEWYESVVEFHYDGYRPTSGADAVAHQKMLMDQYVDASYHSVDIYHPAETTTVHHDAVYKTVDVPAQTHTEERVVGYKCSSCGATK